MLETNRYIDDDITPELIEDVLKKRIPSQELRHIPIDPIIIQLHARELLLGNNRLFAGILISNSVPWGDAYRKEKDRLENHKA